MLQILTDISSTQAGPKIVGYILKKITKQLKFNATDTHKNQTI